MENNRETPGYWAVIPASVRYDDRIPPNAKLLYGEISALCDCRGYCWAKNEYFAKLFGWAPPTVTRLLTSLKDSGYLSIEMVPTKTGSERRIFAGDIGGGVRNFAERGVRKIDGGVSAKLITTPLYNNIFNNTLEHTPKPPEGFIGSKSKNEPSHAPEKFSAFWALYPRKQAKVKAIAAWDKLKADDNTLRAIEDGLKKWIRSDQWLRGFIPLPATWLNSRRWEDEDVPTGPSDGGNEPREERYGWQ